jgi:5-methyltetrahydropteroyltriglutamate--homocysteine methyltransferase
MMIRSTDRIMTTHAGTLPREDALTKMIYARADKRPYDKAALAEGVRSGVLAVVKKQIELGIDSVNDGELGKTNFTNYVQERMSGFETRPYVPGKGPNPLSIAARDMKNFAEYFTEGHGGFIGRGAPPTQNYCVGPLKYVGQEDLKSELADFRAAVDAAKPTEAFLPANTPGTIEHWMHNEYYKSQEEFIFAIAEVMREEYKAIVDAGFMLQIDDPDLPDGWLMYPNMSVAEYRKYAQLRVDALNHALRDIPREKIKLHVCWGSFKGPHQEDIPLKDIIDIIFSVRASAYSIEASNPAHEHEWNVFETVKVPQDAVLIPGVVGHCTDFIEHPELVAQRLIRYAKLVGRENVMGGTDCGIGSRVSHPKIAWAKLKAIADGAKLATKELWGKN